MLRYVVQYHRHYRKKVLLQNVTLRTQLRRMLLWLLLFLTLHTCAMMLFEGMALDDSVWLSLTTITTVGYGDFSAQTMLGRLSTIVFLYLGGIAILAQVAAMYFEYRQDLRRKILTGEWSWNMENHIVFLNAPERDAEDYFYRAVNQLRHSGLAEHSLPVVIITEHFTDVLPSNLRALDVVYIKGSPLTISALRAANVTEAKLIVVLAPFTRRPESDSLNFDLVHRLRELEVKGSIIAEVVLDENRERLMWVGANNVIRPIRSYPEFLVRSMLAPGTETVMEELFSSFGEECIRYSVQTHCAWREVVHVMTDEDIGTPLAYLDKDGNIFSNPEPDREIDIKALFVIVRKGNIKKNKLVQLLLDAAVNKQKQLAKA